MPKNIATIRNTIASFPRADNGANVPDGNPPETLLTRSVMHKKGKQNDYWERDS
jgi:hypothetical protein